MVPQITEKVKHLQSLVWAELNCGGEGGGETQTYKHYRYV